VQRDRPAVESEWSSVADLGAPARRRSSRRGGAVLLGVIVIVAVVVVIVVTHGSSHSETTTTSESAPTSSHTASSTATASSASSSSSTTSTGTTTTANAASGPKTENRLTLTARGSSSDASAIVEILTEDGKHAFYITAKNLPPSNGFFYAVWLYNSATESLGLGRAPAVGSSGRLEGGLLLPSNASDYHEMLLTKETTTRPTHPGPVVLSGPFSLR
jgi:cytoskeletal protein RodZ